MTEPKVRPLTTLRKLRLERGMTQLQLASEADVSINTVIKLEHSADQVEMDRVEIWTWKKLSRVLKVKVRDIYPSLGI